jgi:prepilin signal peptidase PulO-like enzyme (type II secretory pathway)
MDSHSALADNAFHTESNPIRKIALLLTIPCAILPVIMATGGMMTAFNEPTLFKNDFILFGIVYLVYVYGIGLSWKIHRKIVPSAILLLHFASLFYYSVINPLEYLGYAAVVSIMATSIVNQYYRVGSFECNECGTGSCDV